MINALMSAKDIECRAHDWSENREDPLIVRKPFQQNSILLLVILLYPATPYFLKRTLLLE
jgi:hypothetical protein